MKNGAAMMNNDRATDTSAELLARLELALAEARALSARLARRGVALPAELRRDALQDLEIQAHRLHEANPAA